MLPSAVASSIPPPLIHAKSPYGRIPLPPVTSVPVTLHPLLQYEQTLNIEYSILFSPSLVTPIRPHQAHPQWLQEPATCPNLPSLTVRASWQERAILVFPAEATHGLVTVRDVLMTIHSALRAKAKHIHFNADRNANNSALFYCPRQWEVIPPDEGSIRESMIMLAQGYTTWRGLLPSTMEADV